MKIGANDISAVKIGATDVNKVYLGSNLVWEKAGATLLLDLYPNAAAAYSLRKLRTDYVGSSIRVRRSSDNTEQDIGFVGNELDTASLLSFVGAGDGFVVIRYDQSGNGLDLTNSTESAQPQIVNAGALYEFNGQPYILYDGVNDFLSTPTTLTLWDIERSIFTVQKSNSIGTIDGRIVLGYNNSGAGSSYISNNVAFRSTGETWNSNTPTSLVAPSLISGIYTGGNIFDGISMWLDGNPLIRAANSIDGTFNTNDNAPIVEGKTTSSNFYFDGYVADTIIYLTDQTLNREGIETNINNHYTIY